MALVGHERGTKERKTTGSIASSYYSRGPFVFGTRTKRAGRNRKYNKHVDTLYVPSTARAIAKQRRATGSGVLTSPAYPKAFLSGPVRASL